jgi:hypothetical protein
VGLTPAEKGDSPVAGQSPPVPAIRLTAERWTHITEEHCELAGLRADVLETVLRPERILLGGDEELIALRELEQGKHLVVVYRERTESP